MLDRIGFGFGVILDPEDLRSANREFDGAGVSSHM